MLPLRIVDFAKESLHRLLFGHGLELRSLGLHVFLHRGWNRFDSIRRAVAPFDLQGNRVNAKLIEGRYGVCWALMDDKEEFTGEFVSAFPKRKAIGKEVCLRAGDYTARCWCLRSVSFA